MDAKEIRKTLTGIIAELDKEKQRTDYLLIAAGALRTAIDHLEEHGKVLARQAEPAPKADAIQAK